MVSGQDGYDPQALDLLCTDTVVADSIRRGQALTRMIITSGSCLP